MRFRLLPAVLLFLGSSVPVAAATIVRGPYLQRTSATAAVLRIHADRGQTAKREIRLLSRFTGANPHVAVVGVPSLPFDVSDLDALQAIADQITGET